MTVKGAASTNEGVLVVLTRMKGMTISPDHSMASLGPGLSWLEVYNWIEPFGRVVLGGRYAPVGISGYLLGGGISFFGGQYGWAANNVINYEIVTSDSQVLDANATSHQDLFWALKGGSGNYGIVTRFDLITHPGNDVYAGTVEYGPSEVDHFLEALSDFVSPGGGIDDPTCAILPNVDIDPLSGNMSANAFIFHNGQENSCFENFTALTTLSSTVKVKKYNDFIAESIASGNRSFRYVIS